MTPPVGGGGGVSESGLVVVVVLLLFNAQPVKRVPTTKSNAHKSITFFINLLKTM